ncbi:hypothetical protein KKB55_04855 [Myxococcota bacterium]|nr:hypothetical protein [Myxococcota bacterium]
MRALPLALLLFACAEPAAPTPSGRDADFEADAAVDTAPDIAALDVGSDLRWIVADARPVDAMPLDAMSVDAMPVDARPVDAMPLDAMPLDAMPVDAQPVDAMPIDARLVDVGQIDARPLDPPPDAGMGCAPSCAGRACGQDDGCGGACGPCSDEQVSLDPLPSLEPLGAVETIQRGEFTDDYLYAPNHNVKIGVRRQWGGTIIFFGLVGAGPGMNASNVIDANDTGREVQVALYDPLRIHQGCAFNASCQQAAGACPGSISFLGWNPVQGGNRCNLGSGVESQTVEQGVLRHQTQPLHWNPDWARADCQNDGCDAAETRTLRGDVRYQQRLRFVQPEVVELKMQVENLTEMDHPATAQEFPTLYAAWGGHGLTNLRNILTSSGARVSVDVPANDGFFMKNYESPEGWTMLQDDAREYGVGIYYEGKLAGFQAWQREGVFNNLRARFSFGLPPHGVVIARAYLLIGSEQTIHARAQLLDATLPPFGVLDAPAQGEVIGGITHFRGWALDNIGVAQVELWADDVLVGSLAYGQGRPDVCLVYPGYRACPHVGYGGDVDLSSWAPRARRFEVKAIDTHGNARIIARRRLVVTGGGG